MLYAYLLISFIFLPKIPMRFIIAHMDNIYRINLTIQSDDVTPGNVLRASRLFNYFQDAAFEHVNLLGIGTEELRSRGILWVLANQQIEIKRMPQLGETVTLSTWPGKTRMGFFPRHYRITDADGNSIVRAVSMWALIDAASRLTINPDDYSIVCEAVSVEGELRMKGGPKPIDLISSTSFTVPPEYIDNNNHLNNARYMDIAENCIHAEQVGLVPRCINARYGTEALLGETLSVLWGNNGDSYYLEYNRSNTQDNISGEPDAASASSDNSQDTNHFRLRIDY